MEEKKIWSHYVIFHIYTHINTYVSICVRVLHAYVCIYAIFEGNFSSVYLFLDICFSFVHECVFEYDFTLIFEGSFIHFNFITSRI